MDINEKLKELKNVIMKNLGVTSEEIEAKSEEFAEEAKMDIRKMLICTNKEYDYREVGNDT